MEQFFNFQSLTNMQPEILIVEDDLIIATTLENELQAAGYTVVGSCQSGEACLELLTTKVPDLILMDIKLAGQLDGVQTAQQIRKKYRVRLIFLTEMQERGYLEKASKVKAANYLVKPFQTTQLLIAVEYALFQGDQAFLGNDAGFFKNKEEYIKVLYEDICYIRAEKVYCDLYLKDGKKINVTKPLNQMMKRLPYPDLVRIHKSHSINKNYVTKILANVIYIGDQSFSVGETYRSSIRDHFDLI